MALMQAVELGYLRYNPADACKLPRIEKPELTPLDDTQIAAFLQEIHGGRFETLLTVALFTGMREGEVMGLTWDSIRLPQWNHHHQQAAHPSPEGL